MYNSCMTMPLLWISLALMGGMVLASVMHLPVLVWLLLALPGLLCIYPIQRTLPSAIPLRLGNASRSFPRRLLILMLVVVVGVFAGALVFQSHVPPDSAGQIGFYNDAGYDVLVTGTLQAPPELRDTYSNLRLQVSELDTGTASVAVKGLVLARGPADSELHYGDNIRLRGRLQTPPSGEDFSYRDYLARQGIRSYMPSASITLLPGRGGKPPPSARVWLERSLASKRIPALSRPGSLVVGGHPAGG